MPDFRRASFLSFCVFVVIILGLPWLAPAQEPESLSMIPLPSQSTLSQGEFLIDGSFGIELTGYTEPRLEHARQRFLDVLSLETGIPMWREAVVNKPSFTVETGGPSRPVQQLGENESYRLTISTSGVQLSAANPLGVLHGLQTFLQLVRMTPEGFSVPAITIEDKPRFPWRGLLIDSGHRFVRLPVIKRNLDAMEAVKLNVFHWRFSDDAGFHVESKRFPLLQEKASGGFYYTQEEVKEIIAYARDRGIRVIPEFDMPCHTASWFHAYPELGSGHIPGESSAMDPTRETTYKFLSGFIEEMAALFPDASEATMWTDIVSDENLDNRVWPRTAAIAERLWSPENVRDVDSMYRRLGVVSQKLGYYGVRHRLITEEMLERMSGDPDPVALRVLADVVQPPKGYDRQQLRSFGDFTPLNRLDDAVPPESETARVFDVIAQRIAEGKATPEDWQQAQHWLVLWRDNDARLQPLLERSFLTQDLAPVSRSLSEVAIIGLQALDDLRQNRLVYADVRKRNIDFLNAAAKPQAVLLLMVAPCVETLVKATRTK